MRDKFWSRVFAISVALVMVVSCTAVLYNSTDLEKGISEGGGEGIISLMPPPFIGVAGAAEATGGNAFPEDKAGISAYVNIGHEIDLKDHFANLSDIYNQESWELEFDDAHTLGTVSIPNFGGSVHPHLYIDVNGWIVAYFNKSENASMIMQWPPAYKADNPNITEITTTTLDEAIKKACTAVDANYAEIKPNIKYYDFRFPEANRMVLFVKTKATEGTGSVYIEIPTAITLYDASYYHYIYYNWEDSWPYAPSCWDSRLRVDGKIVSDAQTNTGGEKGKWWRAFGSYRGVITTGTLHEIEISYRRIGSGSYDWGSAGVATVLIYKMG